VQSTLRDAYITRAHARVRVAHVHVNVVPTRIVGLKVEPPLEGVASTYSNRGLKQRPNLVPVSKGLMRRGREVDVSLRSREAAVKP